MTVTAIQIGLDPDVIDYSAPDFAHFPGLSKEKLRAANDDNVAALRGAGYDVDNCLIDFGDAGAQKARQWLETKHYDAVLIGAGVRLVASNTLLFESIVNAAHTSPVAASSSITPPRRPPATSGAGTHTRRRWRDDRPRR
jgi:hypothetical protein